MTAFGYNVLRLDNAGRTRLWEHARNLPPGCYLFYSHQGELAWEFKRDFPSAIVQHRTHPDSEEWKGVSPEAWYAKNRNRGRDGVLIHTQNETEVSDAYMKWNTGVIRAARPDDTRIVFLNFAVGHPEPEQWKRPAFREFLEEMAIDGDRHYIGLHEYWPSAVTALMRGGDPAIIDPAKWPKTLAELFPGWLVGRYPFLFQACDDMGIRHPQVLLNEVGNASIGAAGDWQRNLPKTPNYNDHDGWKSEREVWRQWWSQWTHEQAYAKQMIWAVKVAWVGVKGVCVFGWGDSGGWDAFNVENAVEFHREMEAGLKIATPPAPPVADVPFPSTGFVPATLSPVGTTVNVRIQPKLDAEIVTVLATTVHGEIASSAAYPVGNFLWYPIRFNGVQGWCRNDVFDAILDDTPPPAPVRTPRIFHAEFDATNDEWIAVRDVLRAVINLQQISGK